jgi:ankyrin repeat protein
VVANVTSCRSLWAVSLLSVVSLAAASSDFRLADAVKNRNTQAVRALLNQRVDVSAPQPDGATAVHWAAHWDDLQTADLLIAAGANVNATNDFGVSPLFLAASNSSVAMVEKLLSAGANPNAALRTGETALMRAARTGNADIVNALLAHKADVNAKQASKGQSALMWAVSQQHLEAARALMANGADVKARTAAGFTPLLFAAREGNLDLVRLLLAHGADVNESATDGSTALLVATVRGRVDLAGFFLDHGANPDGNAEVAGYTPLHWASGKFESVTTYDYPDAPGEWRAMVGIPNREGKLELIKALLVHGAKVNGRVTKDPPRFGSTVFRRIYLLGATSFYLAASVGDAEVMRLLAANGGDPMAKANDNSTPLIAAAGIANAVNETRIPESDYLEAIKAALELGNDLEAANNEGFRVMHAAAFSGFNTVVQFLADRGAKLNEKTKDGQTPLGLAEGNFIRNFFVELPSTAAVLRNVGAVSEGALTLQNYLESAKANSPKNNLPNPKPPKPDR